MSAIKVGRIMMGERLPNIKIIPNKAKTIPRYIGFREYPNAPVVMNAVGLPNGWMVVAAALNCRSATTRA